MKAHVFLNYNNIETPINKLFSFTKILEKILYLF